MLNEDQSLSYLIKKIDVKLLIFSTIVSFIVVWIINLLIFLPYSEQLGLNGTIRTIISIFFLIIFLIVSLYLSWEKEEINEKERIHDDMLN